MTREGLTRALIDLGWISITQRVLDGRPAEAFALRQMMRCADRVVTHAEIAEAYRDAGPGEAYGARPRSHAADSVDAIRTRVQRLRRHLEDLGVEGAIKTAKGEGYLIERRDIPRIERAIVFACGIDLEEAEPLRLVEPAPPQPVARTA